MFVDKDFWAVVSGLVKERCHASGVRRTRSAAIKDFVGSDPGYAKRWRRVKRWNSRPRVVRVSVIWRDLSKEKRKT